jgi:hypothetical protein
MIAATVIEKVIENALGKIFDANSFKFVRFGIGFRLAPPFGLLDRKSDIS